MSNPKLIAEKESAKEAKHFIKLSNDSNIELLKKI